MPKNDDIAQINYNCDVTVINNDLVQKVIFVTLIFCDFELSCKNVIFWSFWLKKSTKVKIDIVAKTDYFTKLEDNRKRKEE